MVDNIKIEYKFNKLNGEEISDNQVFVLLLKVSRECFNILMNYTKTKDFCVSDDLAIEMNKR